jgi:hypothetical protein
MVRTEVFTNVSSQSNKTESPYYLNFQILGGPDFGKGQHLNKEPKRRIIGFFFPQFLFLYETRK